MKLIFILAIIIAFLLTMSCTKDLKDGSTITVKPPKSKTIPN